MFAKIVTRDRERPICAILLDPGIRPALMDPAPWDELRRAVTFYSGNPTDSAGRAETDYRSGLWTNSLISEFASWASCEPLG